MTDTAIEFAIGVTLFALAYRGILGLLAMGAQVMSRLDPSTEPNRQPEYRRMYNEMRKLYERIETQDSCITFLLNELRAVQKRVTKLEQRNDAFSILWPAHNDGNAPALDRLSDATAIKKEAPAGGKPGLRIQGFRKS